MKESLENRNTSYEEIKPKKLTKYIQIVEVLGDKKMTAREIEQEMNKKGYSKYFDLNHVRPRLTELVNEYHEVTECESKIDEVTNKMVTVYRRATEQEKFELDNMEHIPSIY